MPSMGSKAVLLLAALGFAAAVPTGEVKRDVHQLFARGQSWDASCDRVIPGSPEKKKYKDKLSKAFADAGTLAQVAQNEKDGSGKSFTDSTAFSHYFGDGDKDTAKQMLQAIYNDRIPDDGNHSGEGYTIKVKCGSDQDDACGTSVLAATSPKPGDTTMVFCDRFFKADTKETKQDLDSKGKGDKRGQWCQSGEQFPFFEVAGLTVFHEMTHLHVVGQQAGLSSRPDPDGFNSAGTVDVYVQGDDDDKKHYKNMDPWKAARTLRTLWKANEDDSKNYKPTTKTIENAESYAAAALEFYFLNVCMWDVIEPK
ncbi:hypothetical protein F4777DRAFT_23139 [Nemania sp. FL0916]|nr:hypothetical protein F4777DRAFT_23139 [Nemania sp. FL0916]